MTAPIVLHGQPTRFRYSFPEHRLDADFMRGDNRSVSGLLWSRVAEGRKQVWS